VTVNQPVPLACTLGGDEMRDRQAQIASLGQDGLLSVEHGQQRAVLRFRPGAELRRRIDEIVEAESGCCAFLDFRVEEEADATLVTIAAPPGGEATLRGLAEMFTPTG
jgi:hypothetical protein